MHIQRVLVAIAAGVGGACTFFPWVSVPLFGAIDGTELGDGRAWITLVLCVGVIVCALLGSANDPIAVWVTLPCVLFGISIMGIALWTILELHSAEDDPFGLVNLEFAPFVLTAVGFIVTLLSTRSNRSQR